MSEPNDINELVAAWVEEQEKLQKQADFEVVWSKESSTYSVTFKGVTKAYTKEELSDLQAELTDWYEENPKGKMEVEICDQEVELPFKVVEYLIDYLAYREEEDE